MRRGLLLPLVLLLHTSPAHADPIPIIRITGGSVAINAEGFGQLDIRGRDFRMTEAVASENALGISCRPCAPGDLLNLGGGFAEEFGSATLAGVTYAIQGGASHFFAKGVAPPFGTSGVLSVPFTGLGTTPLRSGQVRARNADRPFQRHAAPIMAPATRKRVPGSGVGAAKSYWMCLNSHAGTDGLRISSTVAVPRPNIGMRGTGWPATSGSWRKPMTSNAPDNTAVALTGGRTSGFASKWSTTSAPSAAPCW
jgi:hypothetical protein